MKSNWTPKKSALAAIATLKPRGLRVLQAPTRNHFSVWDSTGDCLVAAATGRELIIIAKTASVLVEASRAAIVPPGCGDDGLPILPGAGWRRLAERELIQEGDCYWSGSSKVWFVTGAPGKEAPSPTGSSRPSHYARDERRK